MIPFYLTALTRAAPSIQRHAKTREIFPTKTLQNFIQSSFMVSNFDQISCFILNLLSSTTALRHFKRKAMAEMNSQCTIDEDQEMEAQPFTFVAMRVRSPHLAHHLFRSCRTTSLILTVP